MTVPGAASSTALWFGRKCGSKNWVAPSGAIMALELTLTEKHHACCGNRAVDGHRGQSDRCWLGTREGGAARGQRRHPRDLGGRNRREQNPIDSQERQV